MNTNDYYRHPQPEKRSKLIQFITGAIIGATLTTAWALAPEQPHWEPVPGGRPILVQPDKN